MALKNCIYNEDARNLSARIKRPLVDVIITSPPYGDLKDYGPQNQIGFGQDYESEYLPALKTVFQQCFAVTKETGSLWVVVDSFKKQGNVRLLPFEIANICKEIGWKLSDLIIWDKGKTLPWSHKGRLRNIFEYILFFTKTKDHKYYVNRIKDTTDLKEWWVKYPERYALGGKVPANIWSIPIPVQGSWGQNGVRHLCPFPAELVERILLLTTDKNDVVLDPFAGSGMVLAQALCMRRKYIGFELNGEFVKRFRNDLLPSIRRHWKASQKEMRLLERRRKEFESKIKALRVLKYPKLVAKRLANSASQELQKVVAINVECSANSLSVEAKKFAQINLTFILEDDVGSDGLKQKITAVTGKAPLSKFGIDANIAVELASSFFSGLRDDHREANRQVHLYVGGNTHVYKERVKLKDLATKFAFGGWRKFVKNDVPPIFSSTGMKQEVVKTWLPRHLRNLNGKVAVSG